MRSILLSLVCVLCLTCQAFGLDWANGVSPDGVANTTSKVAVAGAHYRIKYDGTILWKPSGTREFKYITLEAIPAPAKALVAARYDQFVPASEQEYSSSTLRRAASEPVTDSSDHSDRSDRSQRTRTDARDRHDQHDASNRSDNRRYDRHDASDRSDNRSYDQRVNRRDEDVRYTARVGSTSAYSPAIVQANNYQSSIDVEFHPVDSRLAAYYVARNDVLVDRLIAIADQRSQQQQQSVQQTVNVNVQCGGGCQPASQQVTTLCAKCWRCGTYFVDSQGRRWQRISGPAMKHSPRQMTGTLGHDPQGRSTFTTQHEGQTVVFVGL